MAQLGELLVNALYLIFLWILAARMWRAYHEFAPERQRVARWALLAVIALIVGDSFHLAPMYYFNPWGGGSGTATAAQWLGLGRLASAFTLSLFYFGLTCYIYRKFDRAWDGLAWALLATLCVRLALLCFPQNAWFTLETNIWKLYRNLPFAVQGLGVAGLLWHYARTAPEGQRLQRMTLVIGLSFTFYFATLIGTQWNPLWGLAMLPKTIAYMILIAQLYRLEFIPT